MEAPGSLYFHCPECDEDTLHHIIKARFSTGKRTTLNGTAKCTACGFVHHIELSQEVDIEIPLILSNGKESEKTTIMLPAEEMLDYGDELMFGDGNIKITKLEKDGLSCPPGKAREFDTIWAKKFDKIAVKIAVTHGPNTYSRKVYATPEEEFEVGEMIRFREYNVVIKKIRDQWGMISKGFVQARDIVRVYCAIVKK